jgi:hypothetical protein
MPRADTNPITYLARTTFRGEGRPFGIRREDRWSHVYVLGATGTGKSTLLETMIRQDLVRGEGLTIIDPHGDLARRVLAAVPGSRRDDLTYLDLARPGHEVTWNPLSGVVPGLRPLVASEILGALKHIWADSWGPRMEHILRHALLTALDQPEATFAEILRLLDDPKHREEAVLRTANAEVRRFWLREFAKYPPHFRAEAVAPIQNKVGALLALPALQRILLVPRGSLDLRRVMAQGRVLVVNLGKGEAGADAAAFLGALLVSLHGAAALSRSALPEPRRRGFFVYLDEFPGYAGPGLVGMLAELRKYRVGLTLGHQHLTQLAPELRDAILGNVGTTITFRVGPADAETLASHLGPRFAADDLLCLHNRHVYLKLLVGGVTSPAFSAETIAGSALRALVGNDNPSRADPPASPAL